MTCGKRRKRSGRTYGHFRTCQEPKSWQPSKWDEGPTAIRGPVQNAPKPQPPWNCPEVALTGVITLTERLYYIDSFLTEFEARVVAVSREAGDTAVILDRSAFYPTSGGQVFDTGWLNMPGTSDLQGFRVKDVAENEQTGDVLHIVEGGAEDLQ